MEYKQRLVLITLACLLVGCTEATLQSSTPTESLPTLTDKPSATPTPKIATITPSVPTPQDDLIEIMADGEIARVFWTDDTHFTYAYYASANQTWHWITYDTADHSTAAISSPLKHDDSIWQQLDVLEPAPDAAIHGYISPTGRYVIYRISSGAPLESGKTEVWIADLEGHTRVKILEQDSCCYFVSSPAWFPDEKQVLFGFGYEGPVDLFVVDIQSGTPTSLSTISDFAGTEFEWALSPDGRKLAVG